MVTPPCSILLNCPRAFHTYVRAPSPVRFPFGSNDCAWPARDTCRLLSSNVWLAAVAGASV
ncbi:hypothetical protein [Lysobacter gummosus]|uniref:hypothetical protein n=1 Tax=Lysobacter gummosus TaxID=262324 RepID=UPI00363721CA